ncbi:hypothetical protein D3C80_1320190 [compost metagenome]
MLDQGAAQQRQVVRVQARLEVAQHGLHRLGFEAEDFLELRVMHFIALQVPVPQAQLAGLQGQGQTRLALAQGVGGIVQLQGALGHAHFQFGMGGAQLAFGPAALLDFAFQFAIERLGLLPGMLQATDQRLILKALQQAALHQAVDLPGHHQQGQQENAAEHAPAALQAMLAEQQIGHRRQQAGQGEGQERRQADGIGHAGGKDSRGDQAVDQGLLVEHVGRHQGDGGEGQGQAGGAGAEQEVAPPVRLHLAARRCRIEGPDLKQAQHGQQHQPDQPAREQHPARRRPEQIGTGRAIEQHE